MSRHAGEGKLGKSNPNFFRTPFMNAALHKSSSKALLKTFKIKGCCQNEGNIIGEIIIKEIRSCFKILFYLH